MEIRKKFVFDRNDEIGCIYLLEKEDNEDSNNSPKGFKYDGKEYRVLGEGSYGKVFEYMLPVAVKAIELSRIEDKLKEREVNALRVLDHPNVVKLFDVRRDTSYVLVFYFIIYIVSAYK